MRQAETDQYRPIQTDTERCRRLFGRLCASLPERLSAFLDVCGRLSVRLWASLDVSKRLSGLLEEVEQESPLIVDVASLFRPPGMPRMMPPHLSRPPDESLLEPQSSGGIKLTPDSGCSPSVWSCFRPSVRPSVLASVRPCVRPSMS